MSRQTRKSIWAVVAGILVGVVPTLATDAILHKIGVFPPWGQSMTGYESALLLATAYRTVLRNTGRLHRRSPRPRSSHAPRLVAWCDRPGRKHFRRRSNLERGAAFGPHWYPLALIVLAMPQAWFGGKLREKQMPVAA